VKVEAFGEVTNKPLKMRHEKSMNPHMEYQSFNEFSNTCLADERSCISTGSVARANSIGIMFNIVRQKESARLPKAPNS